jgi:hypothetical protein
LDFEKGAQKSLHNHSYRIQLVALGTPPKQSVAVQAQLHTVLRFQLGCRKESRSDGSQHISTRKGDQNSYEKANKRLLTNQSKNQQAIHVPYLLAHLRVPCIVAVTAKTHDCWVYSPERPRGRA